ncbi:hypothetical protein F5Y19DRAFT_306358 [Xylariaceae sp. FL1651]|nr:hypothetical protein F5Y19DRAFT_306358 [Xylariaceae sp. FL1651]
MGRQESSPPCQRRRVPHHRRHHRHQRTHAKRTNHKSQLSLGGLNRVSQAPDSHTIVESWLGQVTAPASSIQLISPNPQNQPIHYSKPCHQLGDASPFHRQPRRVDPLWRPQHVPPEEGRSSPRYPLIANFKGSSKRHRQNSSDSSLISYFGHCQEPWKGSHRPAPVEYENSSCYGPLDEADVGTASASSPMSHISEVQEFEKQPRHKTKVDKYDMKKLESHKRRKKPLNQNEHELTKTKLRKRKQMATGKNVMKDFTSEAVLKDRITVQPTLRPGLFDNKRVPTKQPVTDLSFSEMQFLKKKKRVELNSKSLSKSRLRERQREGRELEQVSSFFLPAGAEKDSRKAKRDSSGRTEEPGNERSTHRHNKISSLHEDSFTKPSSLTCVNQCHHQQPPISQEILDPPPTFTPSNPECRPDSSTTTTYFTWSSSHHSLSDKQHRVDTSPQLPSSAISGTPEIIRKALIATGIYKDTGICMYDTSIDQQDRDPDTHSQTVSRSSGSVGYEDIYKGQNLITDPKATRSSKKCAAESSTYLEERWNAILPLEWKPQRLLEAGKPPVNEQLADVTLETPLGANHVAHQKIVQETRTGPVRESPRLQGACSRLESDICDDRSHVAKSPASQDQDSNNVRHHQASTSHDRSSLASRDAMPPPPIPSRAYSSLDFTGLKPEHHLGTLVSLATVNLQGTSSKPLRIEHPQSPHIPNTTASPHEPSIETKRVVPTPNSASRIPQALASSLKRCDRGNTLSNLSTRPSIYENQGKEKECQVALGPALPPVAHVSESMAEFITRIEYEVEEQAFFDSHSGLKPAMEHEGLLLYSRKSAYNPQHKQLSVSDMPQENHIQPPIGSTGNNPFTRPSDINQDFCEHGELGISVGSTSTVEPAGEPRDGTNDLLEMSKFWRPNHFFYL